MFRQRFAGQRRGWIIGGIVSVSLLLSIVVVSAQGPQPQSPLVALGTGFSYNGQLRSAGAPVTGACNIAFRLYDAATAGAQVSGALTQTVAITNGLFSTALDFGAGAFNGDGRWLDMQVRCPAGSGAFTALNPRQALSATPYALYAAAPWQTSGSSLTYNAGYVGIGTANPVTRLHLANSSSSSGGLIVEASEGDRAALYYSSNAGMVLDSYRPSDTRRLPILLQPSGGKVGIGTTSPAQALHVSGANSRLRLQSTQTDVWTVTEYQTDNREWQTGVGGSTVGNGLNGKYYIYDGTALANRLVIDTNGLVGIGTTSPGARLNVKGAGANANTVAFRVENSVGSPGFQVYDDGTVRVTALAAASTQHLCYDQEGYLSYCGSAAEYVPTVDDGAGYAETADLVSLTPTVKNPYGDEHAPFVVTKAARACDENLLGFIVNPESGADGKKLNEHYLPLAIYGYFPAKVTLENGAIRRGDPLTSSSKPGYGMKATQACKIIGYALEDTDHDGTIQVFANHGDNAASEVAALRTQVQTQSAQLSAQQRQIDALLDRLSRLEQTVNH